ncbi:MAG: DUF2207 domain-containing protein [Acidobacteriota bacterium]
MRRLVFALLVVVQFTAINGFSKELHWEKLSVQARLDGSGSLHVDEKQVMVFTGDWNGGERIFRIAQGQKLDLQGITRIDPATGASTELAEGSLDDVDHYAWNDSRTLRWRSRSPSDPPFENTSIVYVLHYTLSNILQKEDDHYLLDHDFAFADRVGAINRFTLHLTFDPQWQEIKAPRADWSAGPLAPGSGFVLKIPLRYSGQESALSVNPGPPLWWKMTGASLFAVPLILLIVVLLRERSLGRFDPLHPDQIDRTWLAQHILTLRAEVVGAIWDRNISSDEVSATLARMVTEGKLASAVTTGEHVKESLVLDLKVPRSKLDGYERGLVDALFFNGNHTSTEAIQNHYKSAGFNPVSTITPGLQALVEEQLPTGKSKGPAGWVSGLLFLSLAAYLIWTGVKFEDLRLGAFLIGFVSIFLVVLGILAPSYWKSRLDYGVAGALASLIPAAIFFGAGLKIFRTGALFGGTPLDARLLIAIAIATLWVVSGSIGALGSEDGREAIAFRKKLTAARVWIAGELQKSSPDLEDHWLPYVLAFGLGKTMRKWYARFGVAAAASTFSDGSHSFGSSSSTGSSGSSWTGGGGAFGGAGASGAWTAAAAGIAAGVAAPSSSSSSGGGGGSSSGGGGGGGW